VPAAKLHSDEADLDLPLVTALVQEQFPQWAELPVRAVEPGGTDHRLYRLGEDLCLRFPRIASAAAQVQKEHRWLPRFASHLPLQIPFPVAMGMPGHDYAWHWSVYRWIDGETATRERISHLQSAATDLALFIRALQTIDGEGGPLPGPHNSFRGEPLAARDDRTRNAIHKLEGTFESAALLEAWHMALRAPVWEQSPVWIHGDLQPGNLIVKDGKLTAVIDFGVSGIGDPACDLIPAWSFFDVPSRERFREALAVDDAAWARGRGWALSVAVIALPYYRDTNQELAEISRYAINEVLRDLNLAH
jgi:aminoglycoside phosphotransferase (APT) family kinase protein